MDHPPSKELAPKAFGCPCCKLEFGCEDTLRVHLKFVHHSELDNRTNEGDDEKAVEYLIELNNFDPEEEGLEPGHEFTVDSGAGVSVGNPEHFPELTFKPSAGSKRGQKFLGPGGDVIYNSGEAEVNFVTELGTPAKLNIQGGAIRKSLLAVSDVNRKNNLVCFDGDLSSIVPANCPEAAEIRRLLKQVRARKAAVPLHPKNGVYVMKTYKTPKDGHSAGFTRPGR